MDESASTATRTSLCKTCSRAADGGQPAAMLAAISLGDRFQPHLRQSLQHARHPRRAARFRRSSTNAAGHVSKAPVPMSPKRVPADDITIEAMLRPYRGERRRSQHIPIHIPTSTSQGTAAHPGQRRRHPRPSPPRLAHVSNANWISPRPSPSSTKNT